MRNLTRADAAAAVRRRRPNTHNPTSDIGIVVDYGVDWITGVATENTSAMMLSLHAGGIISQQESLGGIKKGWGMAGFSGFKVGQCEIGQRDDECIVRLMSECARNSWRGVYRHSDNITRLDLQVTVDHGCQPQPLIKRYYRQANKYSLSRKRGPINSLIVGNDGGATLYCGRRKSNVFARIYAKGPQSKDARYETCVRYEVQFNGKLAVLVSRRLADHKGTEAEIHKQVFGFIRKRGVVVPGRHAFIYDNSLSRSRSDLDRKLLWLAKACRSSCKMLSERGMTRELVEALGIDTFVAIRRR